MFTIEDKKRYFTTGEFAYLCHVKKQTLFHYDKIGLLSPEITKENGYRYYSYNQFELFQIIGSFKEIGIPLKEIKLLLKGKTAGTMINLLKEKSIEIENKIKELQQLQTIIQTKVGLAEQAMQTDFSSISLQYLEEEEFMVGEKVLNFPERKYITAISDLIHYAQSHKVDIGYSVGAIFAREQILKKDFYNYRHFYLKIKGGREDMDSHIRPKGLYVVGYQKGGEAEVAYHRIIEFIKNKGLKMGEYAYEDYMINEMMVDDFDNQITKIHLQVQIE